MQACYKLLGYLWFEGVCVKYRHPDPRRGVPRVCSGGPDSVSGSPLHPVQNSWRLDFMRRRGTSAAFARNPDAISIKNPRISWVEALGGVWAISGPALKLEGLNIYIYIYI